MIKSNKYGILIGIILIITTSLMMYFMNVRIESILNVICAEVIAIYAVMGALSIKIAEKTFLISGMIIVSVVMVITMIVCSFLGWIQTPIVMGVYGVSLFLYTCIMYFSTHIHKQSYSANQKIGSLQICLETLQRLQTMNIDTTICHRIPALIEILKLMDVSRNLDFSELSASLLYFKQHYQDEDFNTFNEFHKIEEQIQNYQLLSQQAKYGKI